jgi:hypothetical protein
MTEIFSIRSTVTASLTGERTNLALRSQEFDNASWVKQQVTVTANSVVAPDGTLTADTIVEDGTSNFHDVLQAVAVVGVPNTASVYVKAANRRFCAVQLGGNSVYFGLFGQGTIAAAVPAGFTPSISHVGNGWYYITLTTAPTNTNFLILAANETPTLNYLGLSQDAIYVWGAQVETGTGASSYKATAGSTATGPGCRTRLLAWSAVGGAAASSIQLRDTNASGTISEITKV